MDSDRVRSRVPIGAMKIDLSSRGTYDDFLDQSNEVRRLYHKRDMTRTKERIEEQHLESNREVSEGGNLCRDPHRQTKLGLSSEA